MQEKICAALLTMKKRDLNADLPLVNMTEQVLSQNCQWAKTNNAHSVVLSPTTVSSSQRSIESPAQCESLDNLSLS